MISLLKEAYLSLFNELLRSYGHRPELVVIGSDSNTVSMLPPGVDVET
jgi:hypothetical protein